MKLEVEVCFLKESGCEVLRIWLAGALVRFEESVEFIGGERCNMCIVV